MTERGDDIRTTAEQLAQDAEALEAIENAKIDLPEGDPKVVELSEEAVRLTENMAKIAKVELAVAEEQDPPS